MTPLVATALIASLLAGIGIGCCVGLFFALQARTDEVRNLRKQTNGHHP